MNRQDELIRAYATLKASRDNIDKMQDYSISEKYVVEFHRVISKLESIGIDASEFRVSDSLVKQRITGTGMGGVRHYSEEKYIEKSYILTKVDALLGYFEILTSPEPKKMGFHRSED